MIKNKVEYIISKICIFSLIICSFIILVRIGIYGFVKYTGNGQKLKDFIFFDYKSSSVNNLPMEKTWEELYPFSNESDSLLLQRKDNNSQTIKSIKLEIKPIKKIIDNVEEFLTDYIPCRYFFFEKNAYFEKVLKWNIANYEKEFEITPGNFTVFQGKRDLTEAAESLSNFYDYLANQNIKFLFVLAPRKIDTKDQKVVKKFDYTDKNVETFLNILHENQVPVLDIRNFLNQYPFYDYFYKTDHHWRVETGLYAASLIAEELNKNQDITINSEIFNIDSYNKITYKESFLGSNGRAVTLGKADMEDYTLLIPNENYSFSVHFRNLTKELRKCDGDFESLLFYDNLQNNNVYNKSSYSIYTDGDTIANIENLTVNNNLKILSLGDSFTDVVEPFLSLAVKHIDTIDLRQFTGSLEKWIRQNGPYDYVICLANTGSISQQIQWESHEDSFDFR